MLISAPPGGGVGTSVGSSVGVSPPPIVFVGTGPPSPIEPSVPVASRRVPTGSETTILSLVNVVGSAAAFTTVKLQVYSVPLGMALLFGAAVAAMMPRNTLMLAPAPAGQPSPPGQLWMTLLRFLQGPTVASTVQSFPLGNKPMAGLMRQADAAVKFTTLLSKMMSFWLPPTIELPAASTTLTVAMVPDGTTFMSTLIETCASAGVAHKSAPTSAPIPPLRVRITSPPLLIWSGNSWSRAENAQTRNDFGLFFVSPLTSGLQCLPLLNYRSRSKRCSRL